MVKRKNNPADNPNQRSLFDIKALRILEEDKDKKITRVVGDKTESIDINGIGFTEENGFHEGVDDIEDNGFNTLGSDSESQKRIRKVFEEYTRKMFEGNIHQQIQKMVEEKVKEELDRRLGEEVERSILKGNGSIINTWKKSNDYNIRVEDDFIEQNKFIVPDIILQDEVGHKLALEFKTNKDKLNAYKKIRNKGIRISFDVIDGKNTGIVNQDDLCNIDPSELNKSDNTSVWFSEIYQSYLNSINDEDYRDTVRNFILLSTFVNSEDEEILDFSKYEMASCVKDVLDEMGVKTSWLQERTQIPTSTLRSILTNSNAISLENAFRISKVLNVPIEKLFMYENVVD